MKNHSARTGHATPPKRRAPGQPTARKTTLSANGPPESGSLYAISKAMTGGQPHLESVLTEDVWKLLFTRARLFATKYINRLRWRGNHGGVLPDGDDAESIAAQAVIDFLQAPGACVAGLQHSHSLGERDRVRASLSESYHLSSDLRPPTSAAFPQSRGPLSCGQIAATGPLPGPITSALSRLVWRHVDRLHHRSENVLVRNEADLAPAFIDDGEVCRFIETIPDQSGNPYENLVHKETTVDFERLQAEFRKFLGRERRLNSLFTCYANGIWQPRDVASRLHLSASATKSLQTRLKRRLHDFLEQQCLTE